RWQVGGDDDLALAVDQRIEGVTELLLREPALKELEIVNQEKVDAAEEVLERQHVLGAEGGREMVHEALGRQIQDLALRRRLAHPPRDGVQEMGLAEAGRAVDVQRIEPARRRRI